MKKFIESIYYHFKLKEFMFFGKYDKEYDFLLSECLKSGIKEFPSKTYSISNNDADDMILLEFKNNVILGIRTKYETFSFNFSTAVFLMTNKEHVKFFHKTQSAKTLYNFKIEIENYNINKIKEQLNTKFLDNLRRL